MINHSQINKVFIQQYNSCILSSYSIIANYFNGQSIEACFSATSSDLNEPITSDVEIKISNVINKKASDDNLGGPEFVLKALHENGRDRYFVNNRDSFSAVEKIRSVNSEYKSTNISQEMLDLLELKLKDTESILQYCFYVSYTISHCRICYWDGLRFCIRDPQSDQIYFVGNLSELKDVTDWVVYQRKTNIDLLEDGKIFD